MIFHFYISLFKEYFKGTFFLRIYLCIVIFISDFRWSTSKKKNAMRKTKDDRVKITTHHFRISIEEEEDDEENKEAEDQAIGEMDRKISITIETDSNVTIGGQESGIKNFSFDQESKSSFSIDDQSPDKILNKGVQEDNWNERETHLQRISDFHFETSIESDSSESRNDDRKKRKMDELVDENFSDDSGRSRKQLGKMQNDSLESDTRSSEVTNENRGSFGSSNEVSPPSTSFEQKGNGFGPIYSTIKYSIEGCSYENANSTNKLDRVGSISTTSFLPFVEISNPVTIKRHGSLSTYETRLSSMNSPVERKRTYSTNEKMLQHFKKALPRSSERKQSITTTPEIQETSAILDHPILSSEVSPLLVRRCYKFMPTFPPHSSNLETGENSLETKDIVTNKSRNAESSSSFNVDPNSKDESLKIEELAYPSIPRVSSLLLRRYYKVMSTRSSSLDEISCKNHQPEEDRDSFNAKEPVITDNQRTRLSVKNSEDANRSNAAQRRSTLPMMNTDLKDAPKSHPNYQDVLSGTSVNPIRRSSIASAAICSSLAPSLVSACQGIPNCLLPISDEKEVSSDSPTNIGDHVSGRSGIRLKLPFLKIHIPVQQPATSWSGSKEEDVGHHYSHHHHHHHHHHHVFPHFHVPTFTFTATATDGAESGRKFNFGIRRQSQMVS